MAKCIEKEIYAANHNQINNEYKESIRSHVYNLRDTKNPLRQHVLSGSISPSELAHMVVSSFLQMRVYALFILFVRQQKIWLAPSFDWKQNNCDEGRLQIPWNTTLSNLDIVNKIIQMRISNKKEFILIA